jgi:hypothetical protein
LPGDIVFACCATHLDASKGCVGKLKYKFTGSWQIIDSLKGTSYAIEHCLTPTQKEKKHASDLTPYPSELITFEPVDGADTRYGQLYKPIGAHPFKEAGLKGFSPPAPFQVAVRYLNIGNYKDFHWPTLVELNDKFDPYLWRNEDEHCRFMKDDAPYSPPDLYTGPPPSPPLPQPSDTSPPTITDLSPWIILSINKLFFIAHNIGNAATREWRLVRVAFQDSILMYPAALQDDWFMVEFYVTHPNDMQCNATNQRFWLQYHNHTVPTFGPIDAHLLTPSDMSKSRALRHHLVPVRCWVNLTHGDTFIHGPFNFATIRRRKTRDCIDQTDWDVLSSKPSMFVNKVPQFNLPTYSIHLDHGIYSIFTDVMAASNHEPRPPS